VRSIVGAVLSIVLAARGTARAAPIAALAFSPDGSVLAAASGRNVVLRSPRDGAVQRSIDCGLRRIAALAFHPRRDLLAAAGGAPGESGAVVLLEWRRGEIAARLEGHADLATAAAWSAGGGLLAVASADGEGRVYRLRDGGEPPVEAFRLAGHAGPILAVAFSPDDGLIVTASADRSVKAWSAEDGKLLRTLSQHSEAVHAIAFRPPAGAAAAGEPTCATASDDRTVRIWQPATGRMVRTVRKHDGSVLALAFERGGANIYTAGAEGIIRRIDADSDEVLGTWKASDDWIYSLAMSPDGKTLASGDWSGAVKLWSAGEQGLRPAEGR
jgi:WD40 repeat protein